ncbi:MAG: pyridoxal 5'-phosphate synthase glutaminase subunit PdxT [Myxococcota bacterium]|jgi:5'-phosphate synthase pdxT subunit|nr:pyridoxal 5'-phosphate synthase glutaminase subunit PdxT [Myxococcota bacterium]
MGSRRVGILAIQGDVDAHAQALLRVGAAPVPVLAEKDLGEIDALVLPGGESTTIAKGLDRLGLYGPLRAFADSGRPVLGTCAGAILLAKESENHPVRTLELIDVVARRNAYGTQVDSFAAEADAPEAGDGPEALSLAPLRCIFIRAPRLTALGPDVEVLLRVDREPVLVRQGNVFACTFHPELGEDARVHGLVAGAAAIA